MRLAFPDKQAATGERSTAPAGMAESRESAHIMNAGRYQDVESGSATEFDRKYEFSQPELTLALQCVPG